MMKLWLVRTGECLKTWEFTTAVKRVAWSEDDSKVRLPFSFGPRAQEKSAGANPRARCRFWR